MRSFTPEISWHNREPVFSVDVQPRIQTDPNDSKLFYRIASAGGDNVVVIWRAFVKNTVTAVKIDESTTTGKDSSVEDQSAPTLSKKALESRNSIELDVVATLGLHIKTVNCAKFAPHSNLLATGGDDSYVYIWKLEEESNSDEASASQEDKERHNPFSEFDDQLLISKEKWKRVATFRRHIEDVVDLAWSPDERFLITGSVDNMALVWDVKKGDVLYTLNKHDGYVQGVAWDPLNDFVATLCTDRSLRFFNTQNKKLLFKVNKMTTKITANTSISQEENEEKVKNTPIFYDDTLATISRRMSFSPNGELLLVPAGIVEIDDDEKDSDKDKFLNVVHIFSRDNLKKIKCYIPTGTYSTSVRFCPSLFKLNPHIENPFPFAYRLVYAIASKNSVLVYDTQQPYPIATVSDIHYTKLSDLSWSSDGRILIVSSTDGYCTFIQFNENELGEPYDGPVYQYESPVKETASKKREKKEKEEKEQVEPSLPVVPEKAKITNFFKKLPAGSPAIINPIAVKRAPSQVVSPAPTTQSNSTPIVNQIQVKRPNFINSDSVKQPRRIMLTTLVSKTAEPKPVPEVLKETNNTNQEIVSKDNNFGKAIEMDVDLIKSSPEQSKVLPEDAKKVEQITTNESFVKENQNESSSQNLTPQRNKRKPESDGTPEEAKQNAKKRINLIQID